MPTSCGSNRHGDDIAVPGGAGGVEIGASLGIVLGPWWVDAAEVPDPHALALRTLVNGRIVQRGHTADLVNDRSASRS